MSEHIIKGNRMSIPESCPPDFAEIIKKCWAQDPNDRPSFKDVIVMLDDIFIPLIKQAQ